MTCADDILTVKWSTDITYDGTVTEVPSELYQELTDRLVEQSEYPILDLLIISRNPLYVNV